MVEKIRFYPMDFEYNISEISGKLKPTVYIYGKDTDGKQICVLDENFEPYFYVIPNKNANTHEIVDKIQKLSVQSDDITVHVMRAEVVVKKYFEQEVTAIKVYPDIPKGVPLIKDIVKNWEMIESTNEYDIPYVRRYSIDKNIVPMTLCEAQGSFVEKKIKVPVFKANYMMPNAAETLQNPRILAFDIETYAQFDEGIDSDKNPILMLAFYGENFKKVVVWKKFATDKDYIEFVNDEAVLLQRFKDIISEYKPDILAGYYSDGFDLPYLKKRSEKQKVKLDIGLDRSSIKITKTPSCSIVGITHLDIFKFIKKTASMSLDAYNLDAVATKFLEEKKNDVNLENLHRVWDFNPENLEEYCNYNLNDARLAYNLSIKMLPTLIEMVKIVGLPIFDINRMGYSQLVEGYIMRQAFQFNEISPNKPSDREIIQRRIATFQGAFVYEPKPGLYSDIEVFDYRSLYPTIISSHNISPGTINCSCCEDAEKITIADKEEIWFCKKRKGLIPTLISDLIARRARIKEIIKEHKNENMAFLDARQNNLKLLANSFYGYLGFPLARWYSMECAKTVTALGRFYIQKVIRKATDYGFIVIYSDTDSIFFILGDKTIQDSKNFLESVNKELPELMELEHEGHYPSGIFVSAKAGQFGAKKKYALLREDGTLKIRGFETVRRNWSQIAKEVQEKVIEIILKENDTKKALIYVKEVVSNLRNKKIPLEKVTIHTQLQKDILDYASKGPHVAVAQRLKNRGKNIVPGTVIKYIVTQGSDIIRNKSKLPDEVGQEGYDANYYINNQVIPSVERIFNVLGYTKEDLLESKEQHKLGAYF